MQDNPTYPVDCREGGSGYVMGHTNNTERWSPYNKEQFGIVEARMRSQEVQPTCLWALAASEAGKPERLTVFCNWCSSRRKTKGQELSRESLT